MTNDSTRPKTPHERSLGTLGLFDEVLKRPESALARLSGERSAGLSARLLGGSFVVVALYGAVAGLFAGQPLLAACKAPLIVGLSVLLCAPSLYVLAGIAGREFSPRQFAGALAGFLGTLALLLLALLPVGWLFTVSSRSLTFVVWLHALLWILAVLIALRFLTRLFAGSAGTLFVWLLLFLIVSLQATTALRPVLERGPEAPLFEPERLFFFDHLERISLAEREAERAAKKAAAPVLPEN